MTGEIKLLKWRRDAPYPPRPAPGTLVHWEDTGKFSMWCPKCGRAAGLDDHKVSLDSQELGTIEPSLVCPCHGCDAHYFVRAGKVYLA